MLKQLGRLAFGVALATTVVAESASATVYINKRYCGGDTFATCAAIMLDVTGTTVTLRVWNLSGNAAAVYGTQTGNGTVFNGIGLYNIPISVDAVTNTLTTTGPAKPLNSAPGNWTLKNSGQIGFLIDFAAVPTQPLTGYTNTIASGCRPVNQLPNARMYLNPCIDPSAGTLADWVTFQFQVNQTWDASNAYVMLRGKDVTSLASTECWTGPGPNGLAATCFQSVPEPMTMTLLATGLVGIGGLGWIRRRRSAKK